VEKVKVKVLIDYKEKLKGYIHWVSESHSADAIVRLYNHMFTVKEVPNDEWEKFINPDSLIEKRNAKVWAHLASNAKEFDRF
jgi:glutaminyl-tRNA synthetase